uniref:VQ domain-containing protein n=1 Tax=Kalanchoe fedtschenkoi TaxID=63787 RepID=A0A7N0ZTA6_KALFE
MAIEQRGSYDGATGRSEPVVIQTDIASFRGLVQRLTGLHTEAEPPRSPSRSAKKRRQPREGIRAESCNSGNSREFRLSARRGVEGLDSGPDTQTYLESSAAEGHVTEYHSSDGGCGEAPELLALFPLSSPSLKY